MPAPINTPDLAAYDELKRRIDVQYPRGRFVAVESGQVLADADSHRVLVHKLASLGKSPRNTLVIQAGIDYPKSATIFLPPPPPSA